MTIKSTYKTLGRAFGCFAVAAGLTFAMSSGAQAAAYPKKQIKLIVPYPPGGATDIIGRVVAQKLSGALGQQVVVDNRGGAGGNIGAAAAAKSEPDGYTLLMGALTSRSIMQTLEQKTVPYNLEKDFAPITMVGAVPLVFVVHPFSPGKECQGIGRLCQIEAGPLDLCIFRGRRAAAHGGGAL